MTTRHDRIFKEFLHRFLAEFLTLFFPEEAAQIDFSTVRWLEQELISNFPKQKLRIADLVAETRLKHGTERIILIHVELEAKDKQHLAARMYEYHALLRILSEKPVLPIALVLLPRSGGLKWQTYSEKLLGRTILTFHYGQIGLLDLESEPYLAQDNPVAATLATLMKPGEKHKADVKLEALQTLIRSRLTEGDKLFLMNVIETYTPKNKLKDAGELVMEEIEALEMTIFEKAERTARQEEWAKGLAKGREEGWQKGRQEGREEGWQEGQVEQAKTILLRLLQVKFGAVPGTWVRLIESMNNANDLALLSEQVILANSLNDLHLPKTGQN